MDPSTPLHCNQPSSQVMTDNFWKLTGLSGSTKRDLAGHVGERFGNFLFSLPIFVPTVIQQGNICQKSPLPQMCQLKRDCQCQSTGNSSNTFYVVYPDRNANFRNCIKEPFPVYFIHAQLYLHLLPPHLLLPMFIF